MKALMTTGAAGPVTEAFLTFSDDMRPRRDTSSAASGKRSGATRRPDTSDLHPTRRAGRGGPRT